MRFYHSIYLPMFFNKKAQYYYVLNLILFFIIKKNKKNEVTPKFSRRFKKHFFAIYYRAVEGWHFYFSDSLGFTETFLRIRAYKVCADSQFFSFNRFECLKCFYLTPTMACNMSSVITMGIFGLYYYGLSNGSKLHKKIIISVRFILYLHHRFFFLGHGGFYTLR